jgi:hypothetical protein
VGALNCAGNCMEGESGMGARGAIRNSEFGIRNCPGRRSRACLGVAPARRLAGAKTGRRALARVQGSFAASKAAIAASKGSWLCRPGRLPPRSGPRISRSAATRELARERLLLSTVARLRRALLRAGTARGPIPGGATAPLDARQRLGRGEATLDARSALDDLLQHALPRTQQ